MMRKSITKTGKSVEEAVNKALENLGVKRDQVEIEIIDEGTNGFFGLFGTRDAEVEVTVQESKKDLAVKFLKNVTEKMGLGIDINLLVSETNKDQIALNMSGKNLGLLIGHRGNTLDALQYLTSLVANKDIGEKYKRITLDAEGYRERRRETLRQLAKKLARKARTTGRKVVLEPMPPHERRIIHLTLQNEKDIKTYSEGKEPYRKVVIVAN